MSSSNHGRDGQADSLNLPHFASSEESHSLYTYAYEENNSNSNPQHYSDFPLYPPSDQSLYEFDNKDTVSGGSINPADLSLMNSTHSPQPSQHNTPQLQQQSPQPASATFLPSGSNNPPVFEWDSVYAHQGASWRNKAPSEYSDISSTASPYIPNSEFPEHPSPLLAGHNQLPQQGSMQEFLNAGLDQFTLNERDISPHVSPRISPASGRPLGSGANSPYILPQDNSYLGYVPPMTQGLMQPPSHPPAGLGLARGGSPDDGTFPQINVIFAPPQRQPTFPGKPGFTHDDSALSPPPKSKSCTVRPRVRRRRDR